MYSDFDDSSLPEARIEVLLDGQPVGLPPQRRSLAAIRSYLESRALEQQRILWSFNVDGDAAACAGLLVAPGQFLRVIGETISLEQMPLQLVENALGQTGQAHAAVQAAVCRVMINHASQAHEIWWDLTHGLKQPLVTLSLLPETLGASKSGGASLMQLRRWQLEQLAGIISDVDQTCQADDPTGLSDALESRVLPWLEGLQESLGLLRQTLLAAPGAAACRG